MALLTKVKTKLALHAHRKVRGLLEGQYASVHTGRSMDFFDLREYVRGDDIKDLDWKASARHGELLVKRFVADRKHTVMLVVATGAPMAAMADPTTSKRDLAILVTGIVGYLATRHGDRVGLLIADQAGDGAARPASTEIALERMLVQIQDRCQTDSAAYDLDACLTQAVKSLRRSSIMLIVADDQPLTEQQLLQLRRLRAQHEVLFVTIGDVDPTDPRLAGKELVEVGSRRRLLPGLGGDQRLREEIAEQTEERHRTRRRELDRLGIASAHLQSEDEVIGATFTLLERHRRGTA
ncbi:DUF58 domain-containing protein [Parenemella sanctibonifatiensis]|uniref:DUF58 domain-containing protein n=1 Tax=Parenemella sanctibonifatiensis TaxID=2016505 RepID=A0A255E0U9_9ACTN|nr:DUF58 domain-containing protein [Parenemella sanctibonifatiensis]OYN84631.1 DUF58 domain-containing protein [Parenemella sanctibonifatiensis]